MNLFQEAVSTFDFFFFFVIHLIFCLLKDVRGGKQQ